ncbi:flavin reductase family protein [Benzoatithermus flavus]|uniref:Flavin reductase family protein n=1 Tax=Benzoatithermus flavus TaxID=3108223 RepID=A0ABU8XPV9_9PROT
MIVQEPYDEDHREEPPAPRLDPRALRACLGCFATGVTIVTALGARGQLLGVTANSFNAVSLDPPLVLFSLDRRAYSLWDFLSTGHFAVNVLAAEQADLSARFARAREDKWSGVSWSVWDHGCPILDGCHASFECSIAYTHAGGDHVIFVGQVRRMAMDPEKAPLLYYRGRYRSLAPLGPG